MGLMISLLLFLFLMFLIYKAYKNCRVPMGRALMIILAVLVTSAQIAALASKMVK